ncbi:MAG: apolipoprotein N-acyltransferase [Nitrospirota bacterium]
MTRRSLALAFLSGLLLTASFPNPGYSFLAWFALVPLLLALRGLTVRAGLLLSFLVGLVFFSSTIYWVTNSIHVYGHVPLLPAALITLLFSAILALFIAPFGAVIVHIRATRPGIVVLAAPAVWVTLELARTHLFSGFPWALAGYSQYQALPVIQVADLTGVYGISFVIVLVNTAITELISGGKRIAPLLTASVVLLAVLGYGYHRLNAETGSGGIRVTVMQGNIEQDKKWDPAYQSEVIATYKRLTRRAIEQKPDLVIWPETATPFYFEGTDDPYPALTDDLRRFVRSTGTPLLTGSPTYEKKERRHLLRNSAFLLERDGTTKTVYHKIHLVPFGEYVPLKKSLLFFVEKMVQSVGDFQPGTEYTVMKVRLPSGKDVAMGTVICYEIIFPDLVRRFVNEGATVITNVTNDAWFGRTGAPYQHFSMAVLRAVENRVPIARAANTGISGFIDANGRILDTSGIFTEAHLTRTLVPGSITTFYTRYGDVFAWMCALGAILAVIPLPRSK